MLRGEGDISSERTRARVLAATSELGYIVNGVASSMRSRQTRTVGLIMADVANPWFGQLAGGVESVLGPAGFSVILANTSNSVERERAAVQALLQKQVDALVVSSPVRWTGPICVRPSGAGQRSCSSMPTCPT